MTSKASEPTLARDPRVDQAFVESVRGEPAAALALLDEVLRDKPGDLAARLLKGRLLQQDRGELEALELFRAAVAEAPESVEARDGLARCLHALRRDDEALLQARAALDLLDRGTDRRHASAVYLTLLWCLREKRLYREALEIAEQGLERSPDAVLAQWASVVEEELAEAEKDRC